MLKDRYFYPLAIALIIGMIYFAMSKADYTVLTKEMILENGFIVEGEDLSTLTASLGTLYSYTGKTSEMSAFVTMKSNIARKDTPASAGIFAPLGPDYEAAFAQKNLKMTVRARQGQKNPLEHFDMGYFTSDVGDSGWIRQALTPNWQDYSIEFTPNVPVNKLEVDYLGVWPGDNGRHETMDVQFIKVDVIPKVKP